MSEPRKLYTGSASGGLDQEQYEAARRRAQQLSEQNARRRTVQQQRTGLFHSIWYRISQWQSHSHRRKYHR